MIYEDIIKSEFKRKKVEKALIFNEYVNFFLNEVSSMFEYKNLPEEIRSEFIEFYLCLSGGCGGGKSGSEYVFCEGGRMGGVDFYGIGKSFNGAFPGGDSSGNLTGIIGKDVAFIQNNQTATPDMFIYDYANFLTEIDISIDVLIKNSRATRAPIADNETAKNAIELAFEKIYMGQPVALVNRKPLEKMLNTNSATYEMVDFTDPTGTERLQHLLKTKDDLIRQFRNIYGHGQNGGYKLAQESVPEVTRDNDTAFIYPNIKLKWRKKGIEQFNKIFGTNVEVDFSESWKITHDKVLNTADDVSRETISENQETAGNSGESGENADD